MMRLQICHCMCLCMGKNGVDAERGGASDNSVHVVPAVGLHWVRVFQSLLRRRSIFAASIAAPATTQHQNKLIAERRGEQGRAEQCRAEESRGEGGKISATGT